MSVHDLFLALNVRVLCPVLSQVCCLVVGPDILAARMDASYLSPWRTEGRELGAGYLTYLTPVSSVISQPGTGIHEGRA